MQIGFNLNQNNKIPFKGNVQKIVNQIDNTISAAIFDLDGVCIDSIKPHFEAWKEFCLRHNIPFSQEIFRRDFLAGTNTEHIRRLFGKISDSQIAKLVGERETIFEEIAPQFTHVVEGFVEFVRSIKKVTNKIGMATSSTQPHIEKAMRMFEKEGLENPESFFPVIIHGGMVKNGKPNPESYIKAREMLEIPAERCVVFEDSLPGIKAALGADIKSVIALSTSHSPEELAKMLQDGLVKKVISNFTEFDSTSFLKLTSSK